MALPDTGIGVTPGSGLNIATHLVGGKEYQVVQLAGAAGHIEASKPTYMAWVNDSAFAASKYHISIMNASGSGKLVRVIKLFAVNIRVASVTGGMVRFDVHKTTAHSGGTAITAEKLDTLNGNLPAQITLATAPTSVTLGNRIFGFAVTGEETGATMALNLGFTALAGLNLMFESDRIQELILREGQGVAVRQITSSTAGTYGWLMLFTVE